MTSKSLLFEEYLSSSDSSDSEKEKKQTEQKNKHQEECDHVKQTIDKAAEKKKKKEKKDSHKDKKKEKKKKKESMKSEKKSNSEKRVCASSDESEVNSSSHKKHKVLPHPFDTQQHSLFSKIPSSSSSLSSSSSSLPLFSSFSASSASSSSCTFSLNPRDDPQLHGGRQRSFAHQVGMWPVHISLPLSCSTYKRQTNKQTSSLKFEFHSFFLFVCSIICQQSTTEFGCFSIFHAVFPSLACFCLSVCLSFFLSFAFVS
jgi:hypothetical protein